MAQDKHYIFHPFSGSLIVEGGHLKQSYPSKLETCLRLCNAPFSLGNLPHQKSANPANPTVMEKILCRSLLKISKINFWASYKFPDWFEPKHDEASQAIEAFNRHTSGLNRNELCLPRSLFAASMSKKFKEHGVIFIGVFLPSRSMHAWIIEDGIQPDSLDSMWVNYQPVAALC